MAAANDLAVRGWGRTWPNPLVGAVIVQGEQIVGAGWHAEFGGPHAEAVAIAAAGDRAAGATLYVTLEPCTHHGKQPPCTGAILAAGIVRVVIAVRDPDPVAAGGVERLRAAGLTVETGVLAAEARATNFRFLRRFTTTNRPFVAIKLAVSMDGMIADAAGNSRWVSGAAARAWVHELRAGFGAVGAGAATVVADDARLTVRGNVSPRVPPVRVIFDRSGRLPTTHGILADASAPLMVVTAASTAAAYRDAMQGRGVRVVVADTLVDAMGVLRSADIDSLLIEGGGALAGALLEAHLVDRVYQVQSPVWLGSGRPAWKNIGAPSLEDASRWRVNHARVLGEGREADVLIELEPC